MGAHYRDTLLSAFESVEGPGRFNFEGGLLGAFGPLEVDGLGSISLPLLPQQAEALAKLCSQASAQGRDTTLGRAGVHKCLQLSPQQFKLKGPLWTGQVKKLANGAVKQGLGLPEHFMVEPALHKLLIYEGGCSTKPRMDTEKSDGIFGTMVIILPSPHSGGELIVHRAGKETNFNFERHQIPYVSYSAGCISETCTVDDGYRLALVYNLVTCAQSQAFTPADNSKAMKGMLKAIEEWAEDEQGPEKLVIPLEGDYFVQDLSVDKLEGADRARGNAILQASTIPGAAPFHVYLGMLKRHHCSYLNIKASPELIFDEEELLPKNALDDREWDDEKVEESFGYCELARRERWYDQPVLILWPHANHWRIACRNDLKTALQVIFALADEVRRLPPNEEKQEDLELGIEALCRNASRLEPAQAARVAGLVAEYGHAGMAETLLAKLPTASATEHIMTLGPELGWTALAPAITDRLVRLCVPATLSACFDLLVRLAPPPGVAATETRIPAAADSKSEAGILTATAEVGESNGEGSNGEGSNGEKTDGYDADGETSEGEASDEQQRETLCASAISTLVARICSGFGPKRAPLRFSPGDVTTAAAYVRVLERFGTERWEKATRVLVENQIRTSLKSAPELLSRLVSTGCRNPGQTGPEAPGRTSPEAAALCQTFARGLVARILAQKDNAPPANPPRHGAYQAPAYPPSFVTATVKALQSVGVGSAIPGQVTAHFFANPKLYNLESTLLPALRQLAEWLGKAAGGNPWVSRLRQGCVSVLEARTSARPAPPRSDWALPATCACRCADCQQVVKFCREAARTTRELRVTKPTKLHLHKSIVR